MKEGKQGAAACMLAWILTSPCASDLALFTTALTLAQPSAAPSLGSLFDFVASPCSTSNVLRMGLLSSTDGSSVLPALLPARSL